MMKRFVAVTFSLVLAWPLVAETLILKDNATITGKILAEKRDLVVVDLGYTVMTVPLDQVLEIVRGPRPAETPATTQGPSSPADTSSSSDRLYEKSQGGRVQRTVRELVRLLGEAVVQVRTPGGLGSGFFLNEDGSLITNFHVIENETQISVEVYHQTNGQLERKVYKQVRILAVNKFADLALLKIEDNDAPRFVKVPLGSSDALAVGDRVFAIGSPLGLERTVTEGIISTKTRELNGDLYLQTTTQINPGNSGGPLFNLAGEVIGVTNMKATSGEGLGFAIPSLALQFFLDHRDAFAYSNDNPSNPYRYLEPPSRMKQSPENGR